MLKHIGRINYRHLLPDLLVITLSPYLSLMLRVSGADLSVYFGVLTKCLPMFILIRLATFISMGVYDIIWRYVSLGDSLKLVRATLVSSAFIIASTYLIDIGRIPRSTFFIDAAIVTLALSLPRMLRRIVFERVSNRIVQQNGKRTLIVGAGNAGRILAHRSTTDTALGLHVIGYVDDDTRKQGRFIAATKVVGSTDELAELIRDYRIEELIVAISKPPGPLMKKIAEVSRELKLKPRLFSGESQNQSHHPFRSIELADLLSRPRRQIDPQPTRELVKDKVLLVTGAGGSIGTEISRQLLSFGPKKLLLLDHSEFNLYQVHHDLTSNSSSEIPVVPLLIDLKDRTSLLHAFRVHHPEIVFHAAAYKHVHLAEANPCATILNNVLGTVNLLDAANELNVTNFVQISTDKAVNPVGVMGSTKRVCELLVTRMADRTGRRYSSVRFGNVLGSSGSLVPLLQKQIAAGGPITVTDREAARYFMLVSEAVSLVLRASTLAKPGEIMILKMGEPIKIMDIVHATLALTGETESNIPIVFTGLRPGEKLYEDLYLCGNELNTEDPDIVVLPRGDLQKADATMIDHELEQHVHALLELSRMGKSEALIELNRITRGHVAWDKTEAPEGAWEKVNPASTPTYLSH